MVRILIADDQAVVCAGMKLILESTPLFRLVDQVMTGEDLVQKLNSNRSMYDLVILDMAIRCKDPFHLVRKIHACFPDLPVVIFTLKPEETYAIRFFKLGVSAFIRKDNQPENIIQALKAVASGRYFYSPYQVELMADFIKDSSRSQANGFEQLTNREIQVLQLLVSGELKNEIAQQLSISINTLSNHRNNILKKLNLRNNTELTRYALLHGLAR